MNRVFQVIVVLFVCAALAIVSSSVVNAQSPMASSPSCPQPDWEAIFGYQPFKAIPIEVEHPIVVYWANYTVMEMLSAISKDGVLLQEKQNKILGNVFTDDGRESLADLYQKIGYDRILKDKAFMQRIEAMPITLGSIKMMQSLSDKNGDGKSDGAVWQVLVEYGLSIWTGRKDDNEQLL